MRRTTFHTALAALLLAPLPAMAQGAGGLSGFYIGGFAGAAYLSDQEIEVDDDGVEFEIEYDFPGYVFGGQIGYAIDTNIRVEAEFAYMTADGDVSAQFLGDELVSANYDFSLISGTAGVYFDLWPIGSFVPYIGGGLGYSRVENEVNDIKDTQNAFTGFGEAGLPFALTPSFSIVPAARFSWVGTDEDVEEIFADNLYHTQFRIGARYAF